MKLTLKIKLLPTEAQAASLLKTIKTANRCCNDISDVAWEKQVFNQFKLHKEVYYPLRAKYSIASQAMIRCISKVADAYKLDKVAKRRFRALGAITYDSRLLAYGSKTISIWSMDGRLKMPFICHNIKYLPYIKGEADLLFKKGKFYLFQTVDIPDAAIDDVEKFIGVDFGLTDIATTSNGHRYSADWINEYREKQVRIRGSIQRKGTKGAKKLLKRLSGKERTTATIINHTISKNLVGEAKKSSRGIAIENLVNIRKSPSKVQRRVKTKLGRWAFGQLRCFIEYKAALSGVKVVAVSPAYTSKTCSTCHHIGDRQNKSFKCKNCGHNEDADINASKNIATLGAVYIGQPEKSDMFSCAVHYSGLKHMLPPISTLLNLQ